VSLGIIFFAVDIILQIKMIDQDPSFIFLFYDGKNLIPAQLPTLPFTPSSVNGFQFYGIQPASRFTGGQY
jgi:hypothetical protein